MVIAKRKTYKRSAVTKQMTASTNKMIQQDSVWKKYMEYNRTASPEQNNQDAGVARAIFIPHSNSLPFEERCITLEQPVKIGRNVYRATPSPTNTIFECRVLSRHHATLYYDKGHFYLVDNQSSNGTFINNNRCSISKELEPHEVFSRDVVQFGIPVVENAGNTEKNTFPPVVALLKLFHPDGKEAMLSFNPTMTTPLHLKELYQLNNFVQEAVQREASLEARLRNLRECVERTRSEARASWELFVGEQRLLMRVHTLETMQSMGKQPDANQIAQLLNDKRNYQEVAQESLRAAHEQRLALEETLERRSREAAALHQHNCALRLAANNALAELQKLAARCERKMCAARLAIAAAEERELAVRNQLPLTYSIQNGEAKMLIVSSDSNKLLEDKRGGSLEEAIRALPDYIKFLLPQHVLGKVGIQLVSTDGKSGNEFDLILKKNNIYNDETKAEKVDSEDSVVDLGIDVEGGVDGKDGGSGEDPPEGADVCTDDEKQSRLNHECPNDVESSSPLDEDLVADTNANSTYMDNDMEESPGKDGVEYANILRVMAGLNEEIRTLRDRVATTAAENEQLRTVRDELLGARDDRDDREVAPSDDATEYRATIADLQVQLTKSTASEEANIVEIQRLSSNAAELEAELSFRPTRADIDDLTNVVGKLQSELQGKEEQLRNLQQLVNNSAAKVDCAISTEDLNQHTQQAETASLDPSKISAEIDEMFRLEYDDDDEETDSVATEINQSINQDEASEETNSIKLDEEQRVTAALEESGLVALEDELVRTKERWAEAAAERARLAARLEQLQQKRPLGVMHAFALAVPIIAAALYYLLLPHLS